MRSFVTLISLALIALGLALWSAGCKKDDPVQPTPTACSIEITQPQNGEVIMSSSQGNINDDLLNIRWKAAGGGKVKVVLYQGPNISAVISDETDNDGYYPWHAESENLPGGADYAVQVASLSDADCFDLSPEFTIVNPGDCSLEASSYPPTYPSDPIFEGDEIAISWVVSSGSGSVVLELWRFHSSWGRDFVGSIASLSNSESPFSWQVNVFGWQASGPDDYYYVKVVDAQIESCMDICARFKLVN